MDVDVTAHDYATKDADCGAGGRCQGREVTNNNLDRSSISTKKRGWGNSFSMHPVSRREKTVCVFLNKAALD